MQRIALTSGEPAGIGPEICLAVAREAFDCELVCLADRDLLKQRDPRIRLFDYLPDTPRYHVPGELTVLHLPLAQASTPGELNIANTPYVLALLDRAIEGALSSEFSAIVTAPVHKAAIND